MIAQLFNILQYVEFAKTRQFGCYNQNYRRWIYCGFAFWWNGM